MGGDAFLTFLRELSWSERLTASSRIWTRVTDSISYKDIYYAKREEVSSRKEEEKIKNKIDLEMKGAMKKWKD